MGLRFVAAGLIFNICRGKEPFGSIWATKFMNPSLTILTFRYMKIHYTIILRFLKEPFSLTIGEALRRGRWRPRCSSLAVWNWPPAYLVSKEMEIKIGCIDATEMKPTKIDMLTLWWTNIAMENHHFSWKIHYKWPFSIAILNYQRV